MTQKHRDYSFIKEDKLIKFYSNLRIDFYTKVNKNKDAFRYEKTFDIRANMFL